MCLGIYLGLVGDSITVLTEPPKVEILSSFFGYSNCLGLDDEEEIIANGCVYGYDDDEKFVTNVPSRNNIKTLCGKLFVTWLSIWQYRFIFMIWFYIIKLKFI